VDTPVRLALRALGAGALLDAPTTAAAVSQVIDGQASEAEVAAFLTALHVRGETPEILAGAAAAVRKLMTRLDVPDHLRPLVDTCGTGGDGASTFNISTATAIVLAACGVRVAKHGNRSASGVSGSADVLTALGVRIDAPPATLIRCLEDLNICFIFAPLYHPALRHVAPVRKQLPFPTLFNLIGPLVNPARPERQLIGVPSASRASLMAGALEQRASVERAVVLHGGDGLDEVTLACDSHLHWVGQGTEDLPRVASCHDFGLPAVSLDALRIARPSESGAMIRDVLAGRVGPPRDVLLANAALGLLLAERCASLREGVAVAARAIDEGRAAAVLDRWVALSNE
jgi:anthranilate phosphoribosyltransferase